MGRSAGPGRADTIDRSSTTGGLIMLNPKSTLSAAVASIALVGAALVPAARSDESSSPVSDGSASALEVSVLGGLQVLNKNDTALPDRFLNVPLVGSVIYRVTPTWAAEG